MSARAQRRDVCEQTHVLEAELLDLQGWEWGHFWFGALLGITSGWLRGGKGHPFGALHRWYYGGVCSAATVRRRAEVAGERSV